MRLLLISSSTVHGFGYLDHPEPEIRAFMRDRKRVAFVPLALHDYDGYTAKVRERLGRMNLDVSQVRTPADLDGIDAVFVGGGNTFRLLKALYDLELLDAIRERVTRGLPYIGSSAGSNVAAPTIKTTNDMPIVEPRSFDALNLVPFQINPHYVDPEPSTTHMGETREERLLQYLEENEVPVVALREGSVLRVEDGVTSLVGRKTARIYRPGVPPYEIEPGTIPF
jgi:dipeptidase E